MSLVPEGRLNLAQDDSPGLDLQGRPVPQGRLEISREAILDRLQPSLRDSIMLHDLPRTQSWVWSFYIFPRPRRLPVPLQCYASDWIRTGFVSGHGFQPCRNTTEGTRALALEMANPKRNASGDRILSPSRTFFVTTKTSMGKALLQSDRNALDRCASFPCEGRKISTARFRSHAEPSASADHGLRR